MRKTILGVQFRLVSYRRRRRKLRPLTGRQRLGDPCDSGCQLTGVETKRPGLAFVYNMAAAIDQIDPVRPCSVCMLRRVAEFVQHRRHLNAQLPDTRCRHDAALVFTLWARKHDILSDIAMHLPNVARVRFRDVDDKECDFFSVLLIQPVKGRNLPPKRRSGITSKNQNDWSLMG